MPLPAAADLDLGEDSTFSPGQRASWSRSFPTYCSIFFFWLPLLGSIVAKDNEVGASGGGG
jgi:hypothetical protein